MSRDRLRCCADSLISNGHKSNVKFGVVQSKQLSTTDLAVFHFDAVVIMCVERGSQIHGIHNIKTIMEITFRVKLNGTKNVFAAFFKLQ